MSGSSSPSSFSAFGLPRLRERVQHGGGRRGARDDRADRRCDQVGLGRTRTTVVADLVAILPSAASNEFDSGRFGSLRRRRTRTARLGQGQRQPPPAGDLVFYTSALVSVRYDPNSRKFYDRKRAEGKKHIQAVLALARRRVNVIWALIRDRRCYEVTPPVSEAA